MRTQSITTHLHSAFIRLIKEMDVMEKKIRKGSLVQVNEALCFTRKNGGERRRPLTNNRNDNNRVVCGRYIKTEEDKRRWREEKRRATKAAIARGKDTFSINFDEGGESRLPGKSEIVYIAAGRAYEVLRARCQAELFYGNPTPGLMKLLDTDSGREIYVKRDYMEAVR